MPMLNFLSYTGYAATPIDSFERLCFVVCLRPVLPIKWGGGVSGGIYGDLYDHALLNQPTYTSRFKKRKRKRRKSERPDRFHIRWHRGTELALQTSSNPCFILATNADEKRGEERCTVCTNVARRCCIFTSSPWLPRHVSSCGSGMSLGCLANASCGGTVMKIGGGPVLRSGWVHKRRWTKAGTDSSIRFRSRKRPAAGKNTASGDHCSKKEHKRHAIDRLGAAKISEAQCLQISGNKLRKRGQGRGETTWRGGGSRQPIFHRVICRSPREVVLHICALQVIIDTRNDPHKSI